MKVQTLFGEEDLEWWKPIWKSMPEFSQEDLQPIQQIIVSFKTREEVQEFAKLVEQPLTPQSKSPSFHFKPIISCLLAPVDKHIITIGYRLGWVRLLHTTNKFCISSSDKKRTLPLGSFNFDTFLSGFSVVQLHSLTAIVNKWLITSV